MASRPSNETTVIPTHIPHWRQVWDSAGITTAVFNWPYSGSGTASDPYAVTWIDSDPRNPMLYGHFKRWSLLMIVALAALLVSIDSSAYSGSADEVTSEFGCGREVFTLGLSLFVLGFAVGPIIWAPFSEMFGRRSVFIPTYFCLTVFNAGAASAQSIDALLVLRFFGGAAGSNSLISAGAVVVDQFPPKERGLALAYYAVTPFLGPTIGPLMGGYIGKGAGWRWITGVLAIATGIVLIAYTLLVPETYAPVLLRRRARKLSQLTGEVYKSQLEIKQGSKTLGKVMKVSLSRPWALLILEPIVTILAVYQAIIYATLYLCFAAFPIVYQKGRGWDPGQGGLAFLGVTVGMLFTIPFNIWMNRRYGIVLVRYKGFPPPEYRLPLCMSGAIAAPIGLFWFAWTNSPSIPWIVSIMAGAPFGFSIVVVFQGINNYLVDSYALYAASCLAGVAVLRSVMAAIFPLITGYMFDALGIHWGSSIPAFLALAFAPFPFLLYKYGALVRARCKYSAEALEYMKHLQNQRLPSTQVNIVENRPGEVESRHGSDERVNKDKEPDEK